MDQMIDLRSDTVTKPNREMRIAMLEADVGDDVYGEDPTVNKLQSLAADMLGMEAALLVTSGTMGNLTAVLAHCMQRGSEVIVGDQSHTYVYEAGGASVLGGIPYNVVPNQPNGEISLEDLEAAVRPDDQHAAQTVLLCLENTHNRCGGRVLSINYLQRVQDWARSKGIAVHLDGARLFNAAAALDVNVKEITSKVTSVQLCLSKGLGAPMGSIVAGPTDFIRRVHRFRKMVGGGSRQMGVIAAPGIVALTEVSLRVREDNANAKLLAMELSKSRYLNIQPDHVESNIVVFTLVGSARCSVDDLLMELQREAILVIPFRGGIRAVTHYNVNREACIRAGKATVAAVQKLVEGQAQDKGSVKSVLKANLYG
eukprot:jgi/Botrbrau1/2165/Bobra.101_2s0006.2